MSRLDELESAYADLVDTWNADDPRVTEARLDAMSRDDLEALVMLNVAADAMT